MFQQAPRVKCPLRPVPCLLLAFLASTIAQSHIAGTCSPNRQDFRMTRVRVSVEFKADLGK